MAFSAFQFVLAAQLLVFVAAEGNKATNRMDACLEAASSNETKCKELSARCTWSEHKKVCYSNHSGSVEDHHGGKGNKVSDRVDICVEAASSNETKCKELSARCLWSEDEKVCYSNHSGRVKDHHGGKGKKVSDRMDICVKAASSNETKCKEQSARCTWSEQKRACYSNHSEHVEDHHGGEGNKGSDTMDICVRAASSNETKCKELSARCTWSEEKKVCYLKHSGLVEDRHGGKGSKGSDRMDACMKAARSNETKCKELSARCTWSEEKKVCYSNHIGRVEDHHGGKGNTGFDRVDICVKAASTNETKCKELSARCTWSEEKKACLLSHSGRVEDRHGGKGNQGSDTMDPRDVVDFALRLNNIQFSLLSANPSVLSEFKLKMKRIIVDKASQTVMPEHVSLDLKPGSVIVVASVAPPSGVSAHKIQSILGEKLKQLDDIAAAVSQVPGIKSVTSGSITATLVSAPVVRSSLQSTGAQASESSKLPFMIGALAGGAALLAFVSLACFLCKGPAPACKAALPKTAENQESNNVVVFGNVV